MMPAMEQEPSSIPVRVALCGREKFPANLLSFSMAAIDEAIFTIEVMELELIAETFPDIPTVSIDAARYRIEKHRGSAFFIEDASRGSIIFAGIAACLSIWFLQQTIGETLKESWLETEFHQKLKKFLLSRKKVKATEIKQEIERNLNKIKKSERLAQPKVRITIEMPTNSTPKINITIQPGKNEPDVEEGNKYYE